MKKYRVYWLLLLLLLLFLLPRPELPQAGEEALLQIHFLDVGQADCVLIACDGEYMLIDGGNVDDGQRVVRYLLDQDVERLSYVICTHPHEDHVGGLTSALAVFPAEHILSPTATYASSCFDDFMRYADQQGVAVQIPQPGDSFLLGGAQVTVLGPVKSYPDANNTSLVLKLTYGATTFLFTGDMEVLAENDMLDYWQEDSLFQADVLKLGHHGSDSSTGYRFLNAVMPDYALVCVGTGNTYGHPNALPLSRLRDADTTLFRTDYLGTVIATSDGSAITFTWEKQHELPEGAEFVPGTLFIGNKVTQKFHLAGCRNLPEKGNRVEFSSYVAAMEAGYPPCGSCLE